MREFRYPLRSVIGDYVRAGVGLSVGLGVLASVPPSPAIVIVFGGLTALFLVFGLRTVERHIGRVEVGDEGIRSIGLTTRTLPWAALTGLKLRYYGTRRQRSRGEGGGFLQLTLKGAGVSVTLESSIEGFTYIAWRAAKAAHDNNVALDPASAGNLLDIGVDADGEQPGPLAHRL
ncbi:MAG: hypothetical protein D6826_01135 [Alphaproteobacteria bacterium]|nr:MAG: hypothetical protein D6826_01135 [Alphaproteobacteria bacterium]